MIAQDFARKGLREAIEALALVKDLRSVLLVVGKQEAGEYRETAKKLKVGDRVVFAGATRDPYAFYRAADYFVLPTWHDPCSLVVLEALAMGVPVISTVFNGACEIMTDGRQGFVLKDPTDIPTLSQAMSRLIDADARAAMSDACLELRPALAYENHVHRLLEIYQSVRTSGVR
jgi:UDP-glucose:(heptosyl)LPS alpha-1,3-glucosyltransferase